MFINAGYPKVYERVNRNTSFIYPLFIELYQEFWMEVRQEIRVVRINEQEAEILGAPEGSQGVRYISRFFNRLGVPLEVVVNLHPLDRIEGTERLIIPH